MAAPALKFIAISGSLRRASTHSGLIRAAVDIARENLPDVAIETLSIGHLPFVNMDLENQGAPFPENVTEFRSKVLQADAVLFSSPEHNYSLAGVLKNAIDWASRPPNAWAGKPAAVVSAGGVFGGGRSQVHLRQVGIYVDLHFINKPELCIKSFEAPPKFDEDGNLIDPASKNRLADILVALRAWTLVLRRGRASPNGAS